MADHIVSRPFKGIIVFAGIALVVTLLFSFIMSAVIPPIQVPSRQKLVDEIHYIDTNFDWRWKAPRTDLDHCMFIIKEGITRVENLGALGKEFAHLDDQIAIRFAIGKLRAMMAECHFNEATKSENSRHQQQYFAQGDEYLSLAGKGFEEAHKKVAYALKAKRSRIYNLDTVRAYLAESDVKTKLSVWRAYTACLSISRGQQMPMRDVMNALGEMPDLARLTRSILGERNRILEKCNDTP